MFRYIYTGKLDLNEQSGEKILGLLIASQQLLLKELFKHIQYHLIENPLPTFYSNDFLSLDKNILLDLLKSDHLQIEEIVAWDCLIKWSVEQTPGLGSKNNNRNKWNHEDFEALKKTLNQFIPFIRFVNISPADFFDKVRPYQTIFPPHIYEEVVEFYFKDTLPKKTTLPPRIGKLVSTIIKPRLASIIANWIDGNDSTVFSYNNKYKFNLIYSKSRGGFDRYIFLNRCNGKGPFVILIKVQSKKIYGGYNPTADKEEKFEYKDKVDKYKVEKVDYSHIDYSHSFIFSFENDQDIHNMKIGRAINTNMFIQDNEWTILGHGQNLNSRENYSNYYNEINFNFGNHLYISGQNLCLNNCGNYNDIFNNVNFSLPIEEIEVFSVVDTHVTETSLWHVDQKLDQQVYQEEKKKDEEDDYIPNLGYY